MMKEKEEEIINPTRDDALTFSCTQENFRTALNLIGHIAVRQGSLPILSNVLLQAEEKVLTCVATNLEVAMRYQLRGRVESDGSVTVNAKLLTDVVNLLPKDRVDVVVRNHELALTAQGHQSRVRGIDATEFPLIPEVDRAQEARIQATVLRDALGQVVFAVATGHARPELCGVLFTFDAHQVTVVATDSYRLAERKLPLAQSSVPTSTSIIVPARTVQELLRVLTTLLSAGDGELEVGIVVTTNQLLVAVEHLQITSRLVDGVFPDYTQIMPQSWSTRVMVDRGALQTAVRAASLFTKTGVHDVHLRILPKEGQCIVRSENAQLGEHQGILEVEGSGDEIVTILNSRYLLEGLAAIGGERVVIECSGPVAPVVVRPEGEVGYTYIIMPIKQ